MTEHAPFRAPVYRANGDSAGFKDYLAALERQRFEYELSVRDHQIALDRIKGTLEDIEDQYRIHNRFFRDFFERRSLMKQSERCLGEQEKNIRLRDRLQTEMQSIDARIDAEETLFYGSVFASKVAKEYPAVHERFMQRQRAKK